MSATPHSSPIPKTDPDVGVFFQRLPETDYLPTWYAQRDNGALGPDEQAAAMRIQIHAATPSVVALRLARPNFPYRGAQPVRAQWQPRRGEYPTRVGLDIEGNHREVSMPSTAPLCDTTSTCSGRASIRPAWRRASAGC